MTEKFIIEALRKKFPAPWLFFPKLRLGNGYHKQEMDAFAMHTWPTRKLRYAFEIKTSEKDFQRELADPVKRIPAQILSTHYIFVVPKGMIGTSEVPVDCGLYYIDSNGEIEDKKQGIRPYSYEFLDGITACPSWDFVTRLVRNTVLQYPGFEHSGEVP